MRRRSFLMSVAGGCLLPSLSIEAAQVRKPRVAFLGTVVKKHSHAQHFLDRMTAGYTWSGRWQDPRVEVAGVFIDQFPEDDLGKQRVKQHNLETGQESADHLLEFISDVDRDNLFINFDPANMILYGTGDPIEALKKVGHLVRSIHCKDGTWAPEAERGTAWGCEVALGQGDVGMETYLQTLKDIGYTGPLTIEREIPEDREKQKADVGAAVSLLEDLRSKIL